MQDIWETNLEDGSEFPWLNVRLLKKFAEKYRIYRSRDACVMWDVP